MLDDALASNVSIEGKIVRFTVALWRPTGNWNLLVPFNAGELEIETAIDGVWVRYKFSTVRMLLVVTAKVGGLLALVVAFNRDMMNNLQTIATIFGFGWFWLFGMNYLTGMIRVPLWLRRGLNANPGLTRNTDAPPTV